MPKLNPSHSFFPSQKRSHYLCFTDFVPPRTEVQAEIQEHLLVLDEDVVAVVGEQNVVDFSPVESSGSFAKLGPVHETAFFLLFTTPRD